MFLLSGDIEQNTNPKIEEQLSQILRNQKGLSDELKPMKEGLEQRICRAIERLDSIE